MAREHGFWWCGGSDLHGVNKPGVALEGVDVPARVLGQGPFPALIEAT